MNHRTSGMCITTTDVPKIVILPVVCFIVVTVMVQAFVPIMVLPLRQQQPVIQQQQSYYRHHRHSYYHVIITQLQQQHQNSSSIHDSKAEERNHSIHGELSPEQSTTATTTKRTSLKNSKIHYDDVVLDDDPDDQYYTIEYSVLFHRHVVYRYSKNVTTRDKIQHNIDDAVTNGNNVIIESFLFLEDAIQKYPHAIIQSIPLLLPPSQRQLLLHQQLSSPFPSSVSSSVVLAAEPSRYINNTNHYLRTSGTIQSLYPFHFDFDNSTTATAATATANSTNESVAATTPPDPSRTQQLVLSPQIHELREAVYTIFHSTLNWTEVQVYQYIENNLYLLSYVSSSYYKQLLYNKLQFLINPLPPSNILHEINTTDDIDWVILFTKYHYGAGLSQEQVTMALQQLPDPLLLLRYTYHPTDFYYHVNHQEEQYREYRIKQHYMYLYEQTPAAVVQITISTLHLYVMGVVQYDIISLSYLHWIGWDYCSCRIMLHAFRSSLLYHNDIGSKVTYRSSTTTDSSNGPALLYLQSQLQIRPWHIHSMCKVHTRLPSYTLHKIQNTIMFLQQELHLSTRNVQQIVLQMPSIIGTSIETMQLRIHFWTHQVGITILELRSIILRRPAILQYNIPSNLEVKLSYFTNTLGFDIGTIRRITNQYPEIWGRSMNGFYYPLSDMICTMCNNMTHIELGQQMIQPVPEILLYNYQTIRNKLIYLSNRLGLTSNELKMMLLSSPRILLQSMETSLRPKIESIEEYMIQSNSKNWNNESLLSVVRKNPSLLTLSKDALKQRFQRSIVPTRLTTSSVLSLSDLVQETGKKRRSSKAVWLLSSTLEEPFDAFDNNSTNENLLSSQIELEFVDVLAAALHAGTSVSNMYKALRQGRSINGRQYRYATTNVVDIKNQSVPEVEVIVIADDQTGTFGTNDRATGTEFETSHLFIHTAGRAFPPEDTVRGRKRSGGMALQIRQWTGTEWSTICSNLWKGLRLRLLGDSSTLIIGYPFTRPSRPRCSLYACREALRVAKQWSLGQNSSSLVVSIACESKYVLNLLHNSTRVYEWGKANSIDDFYFEGPGEFYMANPDILYPLSRMYYLLIEQTTAHQQQKKNITVNFVASDTCDSSRRLRDGAALAATLMYDSVR